MLHTKKSQSILQWYNSLTAKGDVSSLEQFTDGSHFYEIVAALQPFLIQGKKESNLATESIIFSETNIACNEEVITSVEEEATEAKMETSVSETVDADSFVMKESDHTDTEKKYEVIKKFIDDFYDIDSFSLIDYGECQKGKELELAKVAVFLLTALVQHKLSTEGDLNILCLLEPEVQGNILECLGLVLDEKDMRGSKIKKSDLHKVLSRAANCKGQPVRKQPPRSSLDSNDLSEGVKNVPKKRKERVYEDLQDSPLKTLLESPKIQYRAAISRKESELKKLRSALHDEENKVLDLTLEKENLNKELGKIKKDLQFYKKELHSLREDAFSEKEEQENLITGELKAKNIEAEKDRELIETQKEEIKMLKEINEALQNELAVKEITLDTKENYISSLILENKHLENNIKTLELDNKEKARKIHVLEMNIKEKKEQIHILEIDNKEKTKRIHELEFDNGEKAQKIKSWQEKFSNCENDLKKYKQIVEESPASNNRTAEKQGPHLCTLIYADRNEQQAIGIVDQEPKQDGASKRILSERNNSNVGSPQVKEDHAKDYAPRPKEENTRLRRKLPHNEAKLESTSESSITTNLNLVEKERDTAVTDDVSESPFSTKSDSEMKMPLRASVNNRGLPKNKDNERIEFQIYVIYHLLLELIKNKNFAPSVADHLKKMCPKTKDPELVDIFLQTVYLAYKKAIPSVSTPVASVKTRSHSAAAAGKNASKDQLKDGINNLEEISDPSRRNHAAAEFKNASKDELIHQVLYHKKLCDTFTQESEMYKNMAEKKCRKINDVLIPTFQNLEESIAELKEKLAMEQEKYINSEKLVKKKDNDKKRYIMMFQAMKEKMDKDSKEEREKLQKRCKQLNKECLDFVEERSELKRSIKNLEGMMEHLRFEIKQLKKDKRELEQKLWEEKSALSKNTTDRDALVLHYFKKSNHGSRYKDIELGNEEQKSSRPIVKVDAYILNSENEPSASNSMLAGGSIRSSYFQVADEDDFLNESSLAEIHNGGAPEGESGENRLMEIQRRNTLCPPHLQSSYPLEIQNMTPSEKKYYDPWAVSFDQGKKTSLHNEKRDIHKKSQSKYIESDSDDGDVSYSFSVKKRKISEMDRISVPISKKHCKPANSVAMEHSKDQVNPKKPSTPLKRVAAFVRRRSTAFKTPASVHHLIGLQRKSKIH